MSTEEDTFDALRRIPFSEMKELWIKWFINPSISTYIDIFSKTGWTSESFNNEINSQIEKTKPDEKRND